MCGFCCTVGHIVGCDLLGACSNIEHVDSAIKESKGSDGLIVWHFVSRLVDPSKGEVAVLSCLTVLNAIAVIGV